MIDFKYLILLAFIASSACIDFENPMRKPIGYKIQEASYEKTFLSPSQFLVNVKHSNRIYIGTKDYYTIQRILGNGSFGTVYLAVDRFHNKYALKFLTNLQYNELFKKEQAILQQIESGFLSQLLKDMYGLLYDIINNGPSNILVFKYFDYELKDMIHCKYFTNNMKLHVVGDILSSLYHLHSIGFGHFDLKVENIMMNRKGSAILIDFGFAKKATFTSGTTEMAGSPLFMAPEIYERKNHGYSVDMWSFAMLVYEMYMNRPMIVAYTEAQVYQRIFTTNFKAKLLQLPKELFDVIPLDMFLKMLNTDPSTRITSAEIYSYVYLNNRSSLKIPYLYSELKRNNFDSFPDMANKCSSK